MSLKKPKPLISKELMALPMVPNKAGRWVFEMREGSVIFWIEEVGFDLSRGPLFDIVGADHLPKIPLPKPIDYDLNLKDPKTGLPLGRWVHYAGKVKSFRRKGGKL